MSTIFTALAILGVASGLAYEFMQPLIPEIVLAFLFLGVFVFAALGVISSVVYAVARRTWVYLVEAAVCAVVFGALTTMH